MLSRLQIVLMQMSLAEELPTHISNVVHHELHLDLEVLRNVPVGKISSNDETELV